MGTPQRDAGTVFDTEAPRHAEGPQTAIRVDLIRTGAEVAKVQSEEPGAGKLHAGICAGGARKRAFLPRWQERIEYEDSLLGHVACSLLHGRVCII